MSDETPSEQPAVDAKTVEAVEAEARAARFAAIEDEANAMRAADEKAARMPDQARPLASAVERVAEILRARGMNPNDAARADELARYGDAPGDDLRAHQAEARARAWQNDLRAAEHRGLAHWTIDDLAADQKPKVLRGYVDALVDAPEKLNLILAGRVGPGKTSAAIAAGNAAAAAGLLVRFVKHSTYLTWLRPDGAPDGITPAQVRTRYRRCDLLILDDLGADLHMGEASEFTQRETNELVGDRLTGERATVYTTNLGADELGVILGPRAMSRIGARAVAVRFEGPDRRNPVTW